MTFAGRINKRFAQDRPRVEPPFPAFCNWLYSEMQYTVACPEAAITVSRDALVEAVGWVGRTAEDEGRIRIRQRRGYLLIETVHPGGGRAWRKVACQGDGEVNFTGDWRFLLDALDMPKPLDEVVNLRVAGHHLSMLVVDSKPGYCYHQASDWNLRAVVCQMEDIWG